MRIILFGPPGAGKGTQAELLRDHLSIQHISTGNIFREAIRNGTPLGKEVKEILDSGRLVPDQKVVDLVSEELSDPKYGRGYILDGFPRTVSQAEGLDRFLTQSGESISAFVFLDVPDQTLVDRILSRGEGRSDDTPEKVATRLDVYRKETEPVMDHYKAKGIVRIVDGVGSVEEVFSRIMASLA